MTAAYLIAESEITDPELMQSYAEKAGPTVEAHGGTLIAGGAEIAHMDGMWKPPRVLVFRFPSMAAAKAWYNSPEYQAVLPMRFKAANSSLIFVEGAD